MKKFDDYLSEQLKDPEIKKEYDALEPDFAIIQAMIDARKDPALRRKICRNVPALRRAI